MPDNNDDGHDNTPAQQSVEQQNAEFLSKAAVAENTWTRLGDMARERYASLPPVRAMIFGTPIGSIPRDYPYLKELLAEAAIGYEEETYTKTDKDGKREDIRSERWFVAQDEQQVPRTYRTPSGITKKDPTHLVAAANKHRRFCMLRDFIEFKGWAIMQDMHIDGRLELDNIFDLLLNKTQMLKLPNGESVNIAPVLSELRSKDWRSLNNVLCKIGVKGYEQQMKPSSDLPDFD